LPRGLSIRHARNPRAGWRFGGHAGALAGEHWYGRGIAAPQIGVAKRVIFLQLQGAEAWPLVNPEITWRSADKIVVWMHA